MDASLELAQLRQELSLLEHVLQLEKERRIQAERQAEAEKQACLQLQLLLIREKKLRKAAGTWAPPRQGNAGRSSAAEQVDPANSSPPRKNTSGSDGNNSALSQLDELTSSIFSDLPDDVQEMLGQWGPVGTEPVRSRAEEAVKVDDAKGLKTCLFSEGGKAALSDSEKQKLLDVASENGHTGCVEVLLAAGCRPEVCTREDGLGPLHLAALHGHTECAKVLLTAGPEAITASDKEGRTPLFLSLQHGHSECASLVLQEAGDVVYSNVTKSGQTCLHAAIMGHLPHLLRSLLVHIVTTFEPSVAIEIINHPDADGTTVVHLAAASGYQDCVQVLCGCGSVVSTHRDRWNRTPFDVCTQNCAELLTSRDSREVTVLIDLVDGLVEPDPTAIGKLHLMTHHTWPDVEAMVQDCLLDYCRHLGGTLPSSPASCHHTSEATPPHDLWTSSFAPTLKRVLGGGGGDGRVHPLLATLHAMQSSTCAMDWNGDSISGYRIGDMRWKPGEVTHAMGAKGPHALLTGLDSMSDHSHNAEICITFKGLSQGCLDRLGWDLMIPIATLHQYIQLVEREKAVIIQGPRGSGKTSIVKGIAEYFKTTKQASVITFSCHPSIKRDDLLRLFHLNGLLVEGSRSTDDGSSLSSIGSSHHRPQFLILDDLDRLGERFADLLSLLDYRGPDHSQWMDVVCDRDGGVAFSAGEYHLSESCYVMATRNVAEGEYFVPIAEQFAYILLHPSCEPSLGMLQRHLRRKLVHCCHGNVPHRSDLLYRCVQWVWEVWHLYNYLIGQLELPDLVAGPKHFFSCPVEAADPDKVCSWLINLWNHRMVPSIEGHLQSRLGTRAVSELFHALVRHVFKPFCPLGHQATKNLFQKFMYGSVTIDQAKPSGVEEGSSIATSMRRDVGEAVPKDVGVVATPRAPRDVGVAGSSPSAMRNSSHATIVSYKDMIKNSPQFKAKTAKSSKSKSKKTDENNSDTASVASETGSLSGGPPRSRAKTFGLFGRESSFRIQKLFKKNSFKAPNPTKDAPKQLKNSGGGAKSDASGDLHDLFDMFSRFGDSRLDEQRSPAPPNMHVTPLPQPSPAPSHGSGGVVPKYILATSTPQEGGRRHDDNLSSPSLSHQSPLGQSCGADGGQWEVGSLLEGAGERGQEGDTGETTSPAKHEGSLELDLSVSSGSGSHSCLTSWVEVREGEGQPHPSPRPPHEDDHHLLHPSSTSSSHRHRPSDPDDSSSVVLRPHPLEVQQRRQSKRESWLSDTWDDPLGSSARSFSASLGFEPSSFGKKDHRRFSMALVGQEEEVGAEL